MSQQYSWKLWHPDAKLYYLNDYHDAERELNILLHSAVNSVLGFDIEWKPTYVRGQPENPVALIQLADNLKILLIQVSAMAAPPPSLISILGSRNILKVGVGIQGDIQKVQKDLKIPPIRSCADLSLLARSMDNGRWKGRYKDPVGLARLIDAYTQQILHKGKITRSNWENNPLNSAQIEYAASDAHAGYKLYHILSSLPSPPEPPKSKYYSFDLYSGRLHETPIELPLPFGKLPPVDPVSGRPDTDHSLMGQWHPNNPYYDPGPPPEAKKKKPEVEGEGAVNSNDADTGSTSTTTPSSDRRKRQRKDKEQVLFTTGLPPPPPPRRGGHHRFRGHSNSGEIRRGTPRTFEHSTSRSQISNSKADGPSAQPYQAGSGVVPGPERRAGWRRRGRPQHPNRGDKSARDGET